HRCPPLCDDALKVESGKWKVESGKWKSGKCERARPHESPTGHTFHFPLFNFQLCAKWHSLSPSPPRGTPSARPGAMQRRRASTCRPTRRPSTLKPAGTDMAGRNVAVIQYADFIHAT